MCEPDTCVINVMKLMSEKQKCTEQVTGADISKGCSWLCKPLAWMV